MVWHEDEEGGEERGDGGVKGGGGRRSVNSGIKVRRRRGRGAGATLGTALTILQIRTMLSLPSSLVTPFGKLRKRRGKRRRNFFLKFLLWAEIALLVSGRAPSLPPFSRYQAGEHGKRLREEERASRRGKYLTG